MCKLHVEVRERLQEIVAEKIGRGERFTAYEVTQQLRLEMFWVKHDAARAAVHRLYRDGGMAGYDRCLAPKGGPVPAWVYFPAGAGFPAMGARASRRAVRSYILSHLLPGGLYNNGPVSVPLDGRATVCVPAWCVRQAALRPGDAVHVFIDRRNGQLVVRPIGMSSAPLGLPARRYTVDRHANIRITCGTQARAGLHGPRRQIEPHRDELIVKAS
jgi:hypothetical protein